MTLGELVQSAGSLSRSRLVGLPPDWAVGAQTVSQITHDSRQVTPGSVFVGLKGQRADGADFAEQAQSRGAIAVVSESAPAAGVTLPWLVVEDARQTLAALAVSLSCHPSHDLLVLGITGTNGKTTTAYLIAEIFESAGVRCGRLGTVSYQIGSEERAASLTTPEASDIQRLLRELVDHQCAACVMEVSSHALTLKRVDYTRFAAAVFTNVTRDHLDFHGDMTSYFVAKQRLFEMLPVGSTAIINVDDPRGQALVDVVERPVTYAIDRQADVVPGPIDASFAGLGFDVRTSRGSLHIRSRLLGRANAYNILAAVATATALDLPFSAIENGVAALEMVPGRWQRVSERSDDVAVVVDFAHTDDALRNLLETARQLTTGRLIAVFGCGGDRDGTKRPLMGAVAARLSDLVVVTSDNPRREDPAAIIGEITHGLEPAGDRPNVGDGFGTADVYGTPYLTIVDRGAAIERAIREAGAGDMVVIAGKGHETSQVIGEEVRPFDDVEIARAALEKRRTNLHVS